MQTLPFDYASQVAPLVVVQARIGDEEKTSSVVLDTGATGPFVLFLGAAKSRPLNLSLSEEKTPENSTAVGDAAQSYRQAAVAQVRFGPIVWSAPAVAVMPMIDNLSAQVGRPIDGIIGYEMLKSSRFTLNYPKRQISFDVIPSSAPIPFTLGPKKPMILVWATVNGKGPFRFEIDTGATGTLLSPEAAQKAGVETKGEGQLQGAGGTVAVKVAATKVRVAGKTFDLPAVRITDHLTKLSGAVGEQVDGVLGLDAFYRVRLTIDYPGRQVWIE